MSLSKIIILIYYIFYNKLIMSSKSKIKSISKLRNIQKNNFKKNPKFQYKKQLSNIKENIKPLNYYKDNLEVYLDRYLENTEYEIYDYINAGKFGSVYLICNKLNGSNCKAVKVSLFESDELKLFQNEIDMQNLFYKYNLSLKVDKSDIFKLNNQYSLGIIIMDLIDGTIFDLLKTPQDELVLNKIYQWFLVIIRKMCKYNLIHGDLHLRNLGYKITNEGKIRPVLIDFGWSSRGRCKPELEILQLLRLLNHEKLYAYNKRYLFHKLLDLLKTKYKYLKTMKDVDELWDDLSDNYAYEEYSRHIRNK